ncbi:MAG: aminopeptidase [Oscillospiraceae bacterium]|nr:aminopeptidase [Oscillospiraceae bacterium]
MQDLIYKQKNVWDTLSDADRAAIAPFSAAYKTFLDRGKTERLCARYAIELAEAQGFKAFTPGMRVEAGDKVYVSNRDRALYLAVIGKESLAKGVNIAAAHVDSPRLDLKPLPLFEDSELAYLKTHYYGGVRKYQWVATPLALHGVVVTRDGEVVEISVGEHADEPCFTITDLAPHLSKDQNKKTLSEGFAGEGLNALVGGEPWSEGQTEEVENLNKLEKPDTTKDRIKLSVLRMLRDRYNITEEDFLSAELMLVPAFSARDVGLDGNFIGGYGQDDRACAWAGLKALLDLKAAPDRTAVVVLADKEEIGSEGVAGMQSHAFECFLGDLCDAQAVKLNHCFAKSFCLSMDVCAAFDPNYPEVSEKRNTAKMNYGVAVMKYTGSRGKNSTNDASAEVVGRVRQVFDQADVIWQMSELGKVDQGGGGTVAAYMSRRNIDTIDAGVPMQSLHAPFELAAKADCYMAYKAALAVFEHMK